MLELNVLEIGILLDFEIFIIEDVFLIILFIGEFWKEDEVFFLIDENLLDEKEEMFVVEDFLIEKKDFDEKFEEIVLIKG